MRNIVWLAALALPLAAADADAEIIKGVLGVKGAEMT